MESQENREAGHSPDFFDNFGSDVNDPFYGKRSAGLLSVLSGVLAGLENLPGKQCYLPI